MLQEVPYTRTYTFAPKLSSKLNAFSQFSAPLLLTPQLQIVDQTQWRYEVIRPMVLFADRTPRHRGHETDTHPSTVRTLTRRFQQQGMVGLLPADVEVIVRARAPRVPEVVRQEIDRLKVLYDGFHYRELARILFITCGVSIDHKTVKALWQASAVSCQGHLGLWDYHAQPDRPQARMQVIQLYYHGWNKGSISQYMHVSRPTVDAWVRRHTCLLKPTQC